jgi:hypothetical protein
MKLARNAIILSVLLVIIAGAFILLNVFDKKPENVTTTDTPQDESVKILTFNKDDLTEVTIENGDVKYILKHSGEKYEVTYPAGLKFDSLVVNTTFDNLTSLSGDKVFKDASKDWSKYGLDKPATVTVKLKDGTTKILDMGKETPTKEGIYVKLRDSDNIYVLSPYFANTLKVDEVYFNDRKLYEPKKEDVTEITAHKDGKLVYTIASNGGTWGLVSPLGGNVSADKVETILNYFTSLSASNFIVDASTDLSMYGLDKPSYMFEVKAKTGNIKLLVGKEKVKDSEIYAKLEGRDDIFILSLGTFRSFLDMPLSDLMERLVCSVDIKDVSDMTVTMDGISTNCVFKLDPDGNKDKDRFIVNGKEASGKDKNGEFLFRNYYKSLISITFSDIDVNAKPQGTPEVTILYNLNKAPGTKKLELVPANSNSYYALVDGKYTGKIVLKKDLDEKEGIRDNFKALMESLNK